jgi:hypothetical protein
MMPHAKPWASNNLGARCLAPPRVASMSLRRVRRAPPGVTPSPRVRTIGSHLAQFITFHWIEWCTAVLLCGGQP